MQAAAEGHRQRVEDLTAVEARHALVGMLATLIRSEPNHIALLGQDNGISLLLSDKSSPNTICTSTNYVSGEFNVALGSNMAHKRIKNYTRISIPWRPSDTMCFSDLLEKLRSDPEFFLALAGVEADFTAKGIHFHAIHLDSDANFAIKRRISMDLTLERWLSGSRETTLMDQIASWGESMGFQAA